ncbi:RsmB/NOP family class I SAM-dependent RNA methyltransferase [Neomegalonema sp.]|uniref:RsmB/NOP family class I SAM-dependent RNA methyltransferase n=1 Tax=Neomegalonema sp. TaxID=2039713 RepID=UPI00260E4800|nr:RsmB/NOP family class I SAM-dependent RNA methyltransferase [Neomegalonema sp.]MDD2868811.1 RsmB/NOP family class I SAM-dependent RNA methyltransferase [Neomegalonema sp.]
MTPAARLSAAIEILDHWLESGGLIDRILVDWGRARRFAGSRDRAAIADLVYGILRRRRSLLWPLGLEETGRSLVLGRVLAEGGAPESLFTGEGHAPPALTAAETRALAALRPLAEAPAPVRLDWPDALWPEAQASLGADLEATLAALRERAPPDLRANLLKASREEAREALREEGIETEPLAICATALRAPEGAKIHASQAYREGLVEIQDAGSQAVAAASLPLPGETLVDYCAGGGGKALALAALMRGEGRIYAHDVAPRRMAEIPMRAERAGARITLRPDLRGLEGTADHVFVDAPCSGSGSWRRDPEAKWRMTPGKLAEVSRLQLRILEEAARLLRPGGRLSYVTCSLFQAENQRVAEAFLALRPDLRALPSGPEGASSGWSLAPGALNTDGFYLARFGHG